jgi:hypothetical protein
MEAPMSLARISRQAKQLFQHARRRVLAWLSASPSKTNITVAAIAWRRLWIVTLFSIALTVLAIASAAQATRVAGHQTRLAQRAITLAESARAWIAISREQNELRTRALAELHGALTSKDAERRQQHLRQYAALGQRADGHQPRLDAASRAIDAAARDLEALLQRGSP